MKYIFVQKIIWLISSFINLLRNPIRNTQFMQTAVQPVKANDNTTHSKLNYAVSPKFR